MVTLRVSRLLQATQREPRVVWRNLEPLPWLRLSACRPQPPHPAVFVDWFGDPQDARVSSESFMEWSNEDDLKEFLCRLFSKPGGIQDPQGPTVVSGMLLATDWRLQANLSWLTACWTGLPEESPLGPGRLGLRQSTPIDIWHNLAWTLLCQQRSV